jgi:hypothetical protein
MDDVIRSMKPTKEWPLNSLVVKDGYGEGGGLQLVAVMEKRGDGWYWAEFRVTRAGRRLLPLLLAAACQGRPDSGPDDGGPPAPDQAAPPPDLAPAATEAEARALAQLLALRSPPAPTTAVARGGSHGPSS